MADQPSQGRALRWSRPIAQGILIVACFLAFRNGFYREFIFDDIALIEENPGIRGLGQIPSLLGLNPERVPSHRALRNVSYALDYQFWRLDPFGYHLTNLVIHTLNALLVFTLGLIFLESIPAALLAALLFALHPVQTECVTYLSGRRDLLASLFYLLAIERYVAGRRSQCDGLADSTQPFPGDGVPAWRALLGASCFYVLGCLSKELAVTLPAALVAVEAFLAVRERGPAGAPAAALARLGEHPYFHVFLWGFAGAFTLYVVKVHPFNLGVGTGTPPLATTLPTLAKVYAHYFEIVVWPAHLSMDYFPESIVPSPGFLDAPTLSALAVVVLAIAWGALAFFRGHLAGLGAALAAIAFLPMSNLLIKVNEPVAEHYLYLPLAFAALAVSAAGATLSRAGGRWAAAAPWFACAVVLALGTRTVLRNVDWQNPETLYTRSLETFPRNSRLWNNRGAYKLSQDRFEEALADFDVAAGLSPTEPKYFLCRGDALRSLGRLDESEASCRRAIALNEHYGEAWIGLGRTLLQKKDAQGAIVAMRTGLSHLGTECWPALYWLGVAESEGGALPAAIEHLEQARRLVPHNPEVNQRYAMDLERQGRLEPALEHLTTACLSLPTSAVLLAQRGDLLVRMGRRGEALSCYQAMGEVNPDYAGEGHLRAARLLLAMGDRDKARSELQAAVALGMRDRSLASLVEAGPAGPGAAASAAPASPGAGPAAAADLSRVPSPGPSTGSKTGPRRP